MIGASGEVNREVMRGADGATNGGSIRSGLWRIVPPWRWMPLFAALAGAGFFVWDIARFFPNRGGHLGYDYGLFLPWMIAGYFWQATNGPLSPAEFLPSFCGGIPFLFNPQSLYYSVPRWLLGAFPPVRSLLLSWVVFGLGGGVGMYALLRRVFFVSAPSALLGATIFLLNGFYTTRMIIGHATYHGVMLLPVIALTMLLARSGHNAGWRVVPAIVVRSVLTGLLLAYLFYSGGTNIILPMVLALAILALVVGYVGRWHRDIAVIGGAGGLLCLALCAYKLLPALAFAAHVVRPIALRMSGDLLALAGGAAVSLFVPQVLSHLDPGRLIVDRVELEYGVGIVPLLVLFAASVGAFRRADFRNRAGRIGNRRWLIVAGIVVLLGIPIVVNYDGLGLRWLVLQLPIVRSMSVMLRFWFVYIPVLCVLTALAFDHLIHDPVHLAWWSAAAIALTIAQCAATDMSYYAEQPYDPEPIAAAYAKLRMGADVPAITRIADPWFPDGQREGSSRNDAVVDGISAFPCYEPMFGYRMQVFVRGRLAPGPVLESRDGRLNLKNPACYVFPGANGCSPGDEFTTGQAKEAEAFAAYRPYRYEWPVWQYVAAAVSVGAGVLCGAALLVLWPFLAGTALRRR
jgi:hypothetical protein